MSNINIFLYSVYIPVRRRYIMSRTFGMLLNCWLNCFLFRIYDQATWNATLYRFSNRIKFTLPAFKFVNNTLYSFVRKAAVDLGNILI